MPFVATVGPFFALPFPLLSCSKCFCECLFLPLLPAETKTHGVSKREREDKSYSREGEKRKRKTLVFEPVFFPLFLDELINCSLYVTQAGKRSATFSVSFFFLLLSSSSCLFFLLLSHKFTISRHKWKKGAAKSHTPTLQFQEQNSLILLLFCPLSYSSTPASCTLKG